MSSDRIARLREEHRKVEGTLADADGERYDECACGEFWPCDVAVLLGEIDSLQISVLRLTLRVILSCVSSRRASKEELNSMQEGSV